MAFNLLSTFNAAQASVVAGLGLTPLTGGAAPPAPAPSPSGQLPSTSTEGAALPFLQQQQQQSTRTGMSAVGLPVPVRGLGAPLPSSSRTAVPLPSAAQRPSPAALPSVLQAGTMTGGQTSSVQGGVKLEQGAFARSVAPVLAPNPYAVKSEPGQQPSSSTGASLSLHAAAGADSAYAAAILASSGATAPLPAVAAPHAASSSAAAAAARPALPAVSFHAASAAAAPSTATRRVGGQSLTIGAPSHHVSSHVAASSAAAAASTGTAAAASSAARPASSSAPPASAAAAATVTVSAPTTAFNPLVCPECPPGAEVIVGQLRRCADSDPHQGVEVCTTCGLVIGNVISDESEWRTFSDRRGDDPNRVGGPEIGLLADAGLATLMGDNPNGMGNSLAKLQNANALSKNHRKLVDAFRRSSAMAALLHLPNSLKNRSDELYKRVLESGLVRHRGVDALMAACIFMVCKAEGVPRTIKEMTAVCEITPKELARCFKEMKRAGMHKTLVGSRFDTKNSGTTAASAERGEDSEHGGDAELQSYVARWGNHLRLPLKLIELAKELATRTQSSLTTSKDPASFGGAALFLAAQCSGALQDRRTYEQIETECRIATNTLRAVVQQMLQPTLVTVVLPQAYHHCIPQLTA